MQFVAGPRRVWKGVRGVLERAEELQRQTLRIYGELMVRRESWAGRLVFACGPGVSATGLPAAVSIAGGAALVLDSDAAMVKSVFRKGGVDFVVNTLDEALRVLKNEIRKGRPLSVVLEGKTEPALEELRERGVLPELQVEFADSGDSAERLGRDALLLDPRAETVLPSLDLQGWLSQHGWAETVLAATTTAGLRELDARLLARLPEGDKVRRGWIQRIAQYERPAPGGARVIWLTEAERAEASGDDAPADI